MKKVYKLLTLFVAFSLHGALYSYTSSIAHDLKYMGMMKLADSTVLSTLDHLQNEIDALKKSQAHK